MSNAAHPELIVAEGLLSALGDPAGRALESARRLLKNDELDEAQARGLLEAIVEGAAAGCPACGHAGWDGKSCASCGHKLVEAESSADVAVLGQLTNIGEDGNLPPRKRKKKRRKIKEGVMDEATVTDAGATPWGGAPFASADPARYDGTGGRRKNDADSQPRVNVPADRVLVNDLTRTVPPNLRDADDWDRCGNCVFFGKDECNLYGFIRDGATPEVVHRGGYPVDRSDVCDAHLTLTPRVAQLTESLDREDERLAESARAANAEMIRRSRARVSRAEELLTEELDRTVLDEVWSDVARKAAALARHEHAGTDISHLAGEAQNNHVRSMKPGEAAHFGNGVHVRKTDSGFEVHGAGVGKRALSDPRQAAEHARTRAAGGVVGDQYGSQIAARKPGEGALHYTVRRLQKPGGDGPKSPPYVKVDAANDARKGRVAVKGGYAARAKNDVRAFRRSSQFMFQSAEIEEAVESARAGLWEVASDAYPGLDRSPKKNWVDNAGGLPRYIERIAKHLHYEKGKDIGHAIAIAVNVVKKMCASGDTNFPGKQNVKASSRAQACAAVAQWEAKKSKSKAKTASKSVSEAAWLDFDECVALAEEAFLPVTPSWRFVESVLSELALSEGADWFLGLDALDEADFLIERYAGALDEVEVTLDESAMVNLLSRGGGKITGGGHWDGLKHPRLGKGVGGGEFRRSSVLRDIERKASGGVGGRDRQRGYRHPEGASHSERAVAEMFDKVSKSPVAAALEFPSAGQPIMPAERRALGSYLRKAGHADFAQKIESDKSRMISAKDADALARHIRGKGLSHSVWAPGTGRSAPSMPNLAGDIGKRGIPPSRSKSDAELEFPVRRGLLNPPVGGADKDGGNADRAAASGVEGLFRQENRAHGRRNEPVGDGMSIDKAIGNVLESFPGLEDWDVQKHDGPDGKPVWAVTVHMPDGKHVIHVDSSAKAEYVSGPQKATGKITPKKVVKGKPAPQVGPEADLGHVLDTLANWEPTGYQEKPYHMQNGTRYLGHDGVMYEKLDSGMHLMTSKKGQPLAAVQIKNHKTGTVKNAPAFAVSSYYDMLKKKGSSPTAPTPDMAPGSSSELFDKLKSSIGGDDNTTTISGKHFVITGQIPGMTRGTAEAILSNAGGIKHGSMSKQVDLLITGENVGATKMNKAAAYGIKVVPWHHFPHLQEAEVEDVQASRLAAVARQLAETSVTAEIVRLRARRAALAGREASRA